MKTNLKTILILTAILFFNYFVCISQTEFTVKYHRTKSSSGIDDFQILKYKNGIALFLFHRKKETKKISYYEVKSKFYKYNSYYNVNSKIIHEQTKLENDATFLAKWKQDFDWKILEETRVINGYNVQKAIVKSYNRPKDDQFYYGNAIAWFTTDIPIGIGPLRYHGLPGLIIELEFDEYGLKYSMVEIDFKTPVVIPPLPTEGIKITKEQSILPFKKIDKKWLKKQKGIKTNDSKSWWQIWD